MTQFCSGCNFNKANLLKWKHFEGKSSEHKDRKGRGMSEVQNSQHHLLLTLRAAYPMPPAPAYMNSELPFQLQAAV